MAGMLQNVKEQAPERLTYSILPYLDGNASAKIQTYSAPMRFFFGEDSLVEES
jgi:hypothetical protein